MSAADEVARLSATMERCRALLDRSAPFHLNQDGESGWQCAMDFLSEALEPADD